MVSYEIARTPKGYEVTERAFGTSARILPSTTIFPDYRGAIDHLKGLFREGDKLKGTSLTDAQMAGLENIISRFSRV